MTAHRAAWMLRAFLEAAREGAFEALPSGWPWQSPGSRGRAKASTRRDSPRVARLPGMLRTTMDVSGGSPTRNWAALPPWPTPYRLRFQDVALEAWIHASVTATDRGPLRGIAVRVDPHRRRFYRLAVQVGLFSPDHPI
jgi:hypothetical protein